MARRRFFVPEIRRGMAELAGVDAEHLVRVLRAEPGQIFEISDNRQAYLAEVEVARKSLIVFRVGEPLPVETGLAIALYPALFKFDRFEWLLEKATELGVASFHPFEAVRSEKGLAEAAPKRRTRWERIVLEASQQSRRTILPTLAEGVRSVKRLESDCAVKIFCDELPSVPPLLQALPSRRTAADSVAILVGPEGGWTSEERLEATNAGWVPASLGRTVLRAETASVAAVSIVQAAWASYE